MFALGEAFRSYGENQNVPDFCNGSPGEPLPEGDGKPVKASNIDTPCPGDPLRNGQSVRVRFYPNRRPLRRSALVIGAEVKNVAIS